MNKFYTHVVTAFKHPINFFSCLRFPFLKNRSFHTDKFCGYDSTWSDSIPDGWRSSFWKSFLKDLKKQLKKEKSLKKFRIFEMKEKYGALRVYTNTDSNSVEKLIHKYELMSMGYCPRCGAPARYCTTAYVEFICDHCFGKTVVEGYCQLCENEKRPVDESEFFDFYDKKERGCRLCEDDIPEEYDAEHDGKIDLKEEYGVDFKELWRLR